jgi:hypothetical protein
MLVAIIKRIEFRDGSHVGPAERAEQAGLQRAQHDHAAHHGDDHLDVVPQEATQRWAAKGSQAPHGPLLLADDR